MYYTKKKEPMKPFTEKTLAEKLSGKFDMNDNPSRKQIRRFYIAFFICVIMSFFHLSQANACDLEGVSMEDGAGTYWTCDRCGNSNKCYEMSCGRCGKSR